MTTTPLFLATFLILLTFLYPPYRPFWKSPIALLYKGGTIYIESNYCLSNKKLLLLNLLNLTNEQ